MTTGLLDPSVDALINMMQTVNLLHPLARNLIACWGGLPGTTGGSRFMDFNSPGPNGIHGTLDGSGGNLPIWTPSKGDPTTWGSLEFSTGTVWVNCGTLAIQGEMTILCYIIPGDVAAGLEFVASSSNTGATQDFGLELNRTAAKIGVLWGNAVIVTGDASLVAGQPHMVGFTRAGSAGDWTARLYVDGKFDKEGATATNPNGSIPTLTLGALGGAFSFPFSGELTSAWLYGRPLTDNEIAFHNRLNGLNYPGLLNRIANVSLIGATEPTPINGAGLPPYGQVIFNSADEENRPRYGQRITRGTEQ